MMPHPQARVIAVTPNPAIDVTITVDKLVDETTHRIDKADRRLGGKGVNVGAVAAAQGYPSVLMGPADTATLELITRRGMRLPDGATIAFTDTPVPMRETWAIHRTGDNATVIINERGGQHPDTTWETMARDLTAAAHGAPGSVVTISGSWPPGTSQDTLGLLLDAARDGGAKAVIVDCAGDNLLAACRAGAIVKPNAAEIQETTGLVDPREGAARLVDEGSQLVVVSLGEEGLIAATATTTVAARLPQPLQGNPTGCGDALVAALATGIVDDLDLPDLITRAVAWSAAAVLVPYAGAIDESWPTLATQVTARTLS